jgi:hypothetical protein
MAFGRIDVFFPDGSFKTFSLSAPATSIGRAAENAIALDTPAIAPRQAEILFADGQASLINRDTARGTYIDGIRLEAGKQRALFGGEEIQMGNLRLIYHFYDDTPTRPVIVPEEATQRVEIAAPDFTVDVLGPDQAVAPGAHIAAQLSIRNTGKTKERYLVSISGLPRDWVRLDRSEIEVAPGQVGDIIVNFKPARRSESAPGRYRVFFTTQLARSPDAAIKCEVTLHVLPFSGFGMALESSKIGSGERFRLYLHNQGSAPLDLNLSARDLSNQLRFALPSSVISLTPGQRTVVEGAALPKSMHLWGAPKQAPFDLVVRARTPAAYTAAVRGQATIKPSLPKWAPAVGVLALAALILLTLFVLFNLPSAAEPQINAFNASSGQVTRGERLQLSWDIDDADTLELLVNGSVTASGIDPRIGTLDIDTSNYTGVVLLTLRAANRTGTSQAVQVVEVSAPMNVSYFEVEPQTLVRYVVQTLTLNWSVEGAVTTRLSGLESFTPSPLSGSYGASGTVQIAGIPTAPLTIALTGQDAAGMTIESLTNISLIDPICLPTGTDVTLYAAPSTDAQVIGSVATESTVVVDAQDETGQWLRVQLAGGASGWGARNLFVCDPAFDPGQLQKSIQLPIGPTASPTFAPTPTPMTTVTPPTVIAPTATGRLGG